MYFDFQLEVKKTTVLVLPIPGEIMYFPDFMKKVKDSGKKIKQIWIR